MKKVMVLIPFEDAGKKRLEAAASDCEFIYEYNIEALADVSAILGSAPADRLASSEKLEWVQLPSAGTEPYSRPAVLPENCVLTNATGAFGLAISEHMVGCVLMLYKKLHLYRDNQNKALWLDRGTVKRIEGAVTLIVGLGDIGGRFAQKMKSLGTYTIGIRRTVSDKPGYIDELYTAEALDNLLPRADIVALTLPGTDATRNIMSRERLFKMKEGATLLNIGRGSAVDTMALCDALNSGLLYAAALDVTDPEPLLPGHPLWSCENAFITPHISGFFHMRDTYDNIIDICVNNMKRFHDRLPLLNIVDFNTGYRKTDHNIKVIR